MSLATSNETPLEQMQTKLEGDTVYLRLFDDSETKGRIEIERKRDPVETWTFGVDTDRIAHFRETSEDVDLSEPEIPAWVTDLLAASDVTEIEK